MLRLWPLLLRRIDKGVVEFRRWLTDVPEGFKEIKKASFLRIDAVASAGLGISRRTMWELCLDGKVVYNGQDVVKKSRTVKEGDIIDVDYVERDSSLDSKDWPKGRVIVKEIKNTTRKGGKYHVVLHRCLRFRTT